MGFINNSSKQKKEQAANFYDNLELYHKNVDKILELIQDYFDHRKTRFNAKYMAVKVCEGKVLESTEELGEEAKNRIGYWSRNEKTELKDSIFTIEFFDKIFFCKIFEFDEDHQILAGYLLEETALVRTFISKFSEEKIREKYEKLLSII